ncbi:MAG: exopolysaccharide biosynthesis polyprenyl glycosylphosphotransferase [Flammeovirgaceae bacterium]
MIKPYATYFPITQLAIDFVLLNVVFFAAYYYCFDGLQFADERYWLLLASANAIWGGIYFSLKLYTIDRSTEKDQFMQLLLAAVLIHPLVWQGFILVTRSTYASILHLWFTAGLFASGQLLINGIQMYTKRFFLQEQPYRKRIVILGYNPIAHQLKAFFENQASDKFLFVGYIAAHTQLHQEQVIGSLTSLNELLVQQGIEEVYSCLDSAALVEMQELLQAAEKHVIKLHIVPDIQGMRAKKAMNRLPFGSTAYGGIPIIHVNANPLDHQLNRIAKRLFDVSFSCFVCVFILSWCVPMIALWIRFDSEGPVFFKQKRHGMHGRVFWCWKFRTMTVQHGESAFKQATKNDARVTKAGAWLRKNSLDELPQFINVLLGDMSIVGPRPHPIQLNENYTGRIDKFMSRHLVKPGITGLAQVNNHRGETPTIAHMENRIALDQFYITHWSFWLDIKIVVKTILLILKGSNQAY